MLKAIWWRQISRLFATSWSLTLVYRGEAMLWLIAITAAPLLSLVIWYSVARSSGQDLQQEVLTYYLILILVRAISSTWRGYELIREILDGNIVNYLIRPSVIYWEFVTSFFASKILWLAPPLGLFAVLLAVAPQLLSPAIFSWDRFLLFLFSLALAVVLSFTFDLCLGLTAFWLEEAQELMAYRYLLTHVASGVLIPYALMPAWLSTTLSLLPFRYTVSAPVEIWMGQVAGFAALNMIAIQIVWALAFIIFMRVLYVRGRKRYVVPGQ